MALKDEGNPALGKDAASTPHTCPRVDDGGEGPTAASLSRAACSAESRLIKNP